MLKYKCLVLDHDDTIVQTERAIGFPYFKSYIERIRPGKTLTFEEYIHDCNNMVFVEMCKERWQFTDAESQEEYLGWKQYCLDHIPPLCQGVANIIQKQKELGGLVCVSSLSTAEIIRRDFMHHIGFCPDAIYDNDLPSQRRKPNPYALVDIMQKFDLNEGEILVIDDMKLGWQMASACNIKFAFAGWSRPEFPEISKEMEAISDYAFYHADSLYEFLFG